MEKFTPEQARILSKISQSKMAEILNISLNAYINKEKGLSRFYVDEAIKFSEAVSIPLEKIIFLPGLCHKNGT